MNNKYILSTKDFIKKLLIEEKLDWDDIVTFTERNSKPSYMITGVEDDGYFGVYQIRYDSSLTFHEYIDTEEGKEFIKQQIPEAKNLNITVFNDFTIRELLKLVIENNINLDAKISINETEEGYLYPFINYIADKNEITICVG